MDLTNYIQDRNEAFASMDKEKILAYCKKYKIKIPENSPISLEQYNESYEWLTERGHTPSIMGGEK